MYIILINLFLYEDEHIMNIYEQLNKINDNDSLSEKYNVKNPKELKKLKESYKSRKCLKEDYEIDGEQVSWPEYFEYRMEEDEFFMDDNLFQEFADKAYQLVEAEGFTDVFTEPSTQMGRGGDFFWAKKDGVNYRGVFDFETEQEYFYEAASSADSFDEAIDNLAKCYAHIIIDNLHPDDDEDFDESLKEGTYSNRVEGNNRYFDTMGNKIRYCLLDVIRCKGYAALYMYMKNLDPVAFSAYAPDFTTKLGELYQDESVDINRADTFGKIADDLQQQFIKMVSKVDSKKHSVYEDKTPEELWNNSPVEIDREHYAKVQNFKKKFGID